MGARYGKGTAWRPDLRCQLQQVVKRVFLIDKTPGFHQPPREINNYWTCVNNWVWRAIHLSVPIKCYIIAELENLIHILSFQPFSCRTEVESQSPPSTKIDVFNYHYRRHNIFAAGKPCQGNFYTPEKATIRGVHRELIVVGGNIWWLQWAFLDSPLKWIIWS